MRVIDLGLIRLACVIAWSCPPSWVSARPRALNPFRGSRAR